MGFELRRLDTRKIHYFRDGEDTSLCSSVRSRAGTTLVVSGDFEDFCVQCMAERRNTRKYEEGKTMPGATAYMPRRGPHKDHRKE